MVTTVSITEFRTNLFTLTSKLVSERGELIVEKDGKSLFHITAITDTPSERAKKALEFLPKLTGKFGKPDKAFFRGKKETVYMKRLGTLS